MTDDTQYVEVFFDEILHETEPGEKNVGAYLLLIEDEKVWLPKSQCEISEDGIIVVPEWMAIEEELV